MKLHPRHDLTTKAKIDIQESIATAVGRHPDITHAELHHILAGIVLAWSIFAVRDERLEEDRPCPACNGMPTADPNNPSAACWQCGGRQIS